MLRRRSHRALFRRAFCLRVAVTYIAEPRVKPLSRVNRNWWLTPLVWKLMEKFRRVNHISAGRRTHAASKLDGWRGVLASGRIFVAAVASLNFRFRAVEASQSNIVGGVGYSGQACEAPASISCLKVESFYKQEKNEVVFVKLTKISPVSSEQWTRNLFQRKMPV